jgi:hypothetical protein
MISLAVTGAYTTIRSYVGLQSVQRAFPAPVAVGAKKWPKIKIGWCGLRLATRKIQRAAMRQHPSLME